MSDTTVREDLMRGIEKQKLNSKPMSGDERGAAMAAQALNSALLGFGDDAAGAIDFLDDVIRGRHPDYSAAVDKAHVLRQRLAQQHPGLSFGSGLTGGIASGGLVGTAVGLPKVGMTLGGLISPMTSAEEGSLKHNLHSKNGDISGARPRDKGPYGTKKGN